MKKKTAQLIIPGSDSQNPRKQANQTPYDSSVSTPQNYPQPRIHSPNIVHTASRGPIRRTAQTSLSSSSSLAAGSIQSVAQAPLYYDYRWSTPDKYYFPRNRVVANAIWREIYKRDAAVAIATDMYGELPWSQFDLVGIDDNEIKKLYEDMFNELNIVPKLPDFTRDYLVTGELILHTLFNSSKGYWERVIPHDPDYIRVEGVGLALEQPLLWLRPTPEIKRLINSPDPRVRKLQKTLPRDIINAFRMNRDVPLESLNTTFMARLNSSTDIRGTSLYTRLYRTVMYEDFVVNASLAIAQRHAAPLRMFKMGDPATGWLPNDDDLAAFSEMLSMAESDPLSAIVTHHNVTCELVGVSDRVLLISREWDYIERSKLLALGVAKSFLLGETSFACFEQGTPVVMSNGTPTYIELVEEGDKVLDKNGKPKKVVKNWCEGIPETLLEVEVWGGRKFRVTPNHRFPAWMWPTECACGCGEKIKRVGRAFAKQKHAAKTGRKNYHTVECPAMVHAGRHRITTLPEGYNPERIVEAQELRKGDFLKVPRTHAISNTVDEFLNKDSARLLGYYLAEGDVSYGGSKKKMAEKVLPSELRLTFAKHELATWIKDIQGICSRLGIRHELYLPETRPTVAVVRVIPKNKDFLKWVKKHAGEKSCYKCLSEEVMNWPEVFVAEVLRGYIRGDGCRNDKPTPSQRLNNSKTLANCQFGTTSRKLATQLILLLTRFGIPVGHGIGYPKATKYKRKPYHIMRIQSEAAVCLCSFVWSEELVATTHRSSVWCDENYMYLPVRAVKEVKNTKPVWNLEIEDTHTYLVCDGVATCNSAVAGLQTLLERLVTMRLKFEHDWMIKKLCKPVAEMHDFYKRPQSELEHRIRIKTPDEMELIVPTIKWQKNLDSMQDASILSVWRDLKDRGILSDRTYGAGAGVDLDVERKNQVEEKQYVEDNPEIFGMPDEAEEEVPGKGLPGGAPGGAPKAPAAPKKELPPPLPLPGGSEKFNKRGETLYDELEDKLSALANMEDRVSVADVIDIVKELPDNEIRKDREFPLPAEKSLLVGK